MKFKERLPLIEAEQYAKEDSPGKIREMLERRLPRRRIVVAVIPERERFNERLLIIVDAEQDTIEAGWWVYVMENRMHVVSDEDFKRMFVPETGVA